MMFILPIAGPITRELSLSLAYQHSYDEEPNDEEEGGENRAITD